MKKTKRKKIVFLAGLCGLTIFALGCGGNDEEASKVELNFSEIEKQGETLETGENLDESSEVTDPPENPSPEEAPPPAEGTPPPEEILSEGVSNQTPRTPQPDSLIDGKPEGYPTEFWWSLILSWVNEPIPVVRHEDRYIWRDPANSDAPPEVIPELVALAEELLPQVLMENNPDGSPSKLDNLMITGTGVAKGTIRGSSFNNSREAPMYRAAVMWHARRDQQGRAAANRVTEMLFMGTPGNWRFLRCKELQSPWEARTCSPFVQSVV